MSHAQLGQVKWDANGVPHSVLFDDQYFCKDNGYEEAVHVCLQGNSLRERFERLSPDVSGTFTIIETGFGTGLDFCSAWKLWDECSPETWSLNFISLELFPLSREDLSQALGLWPMLSVYKDALVVQYRPALGETRSVSFNGGRVRLTIVFDHVVAALERIKTERLAGLGADAWFLDGFGPAKNPEMWSSQVFEGMAALSRPGTTLSTFTVAGFVRRGLEAHGFVVRRVPGHGKKKQILTGLFQGPKV